MLLAVPNFSEGRDAELIDAVTERLRRRAPSSSTATPTPSTTAPCSPSPREPGGSRRALAGGARPASRASTSRPTTAPIPASARSTSARSSSPSRADREAARARGARRRPSAIAALERPGLPLRRARRERRSAASAPSSAAAGRRSWRGGWAGELAPDLGPGRAPPDRGATLVTARAAAGRLQRRARHRRARDRARRSPAELRESGGGLPGVRAMAVDLGRARAAGLDQRPRPDRGAARRRWSSEIRELAAEHGARPVEAELVGLVPEAALDGLSGRPAAAAASTPTAT